MTAIVVRMDAHVDAPGPVVADGKLVVSRLTAGESAIRSAVTSIKLVLEGEEIHEVDGRPYIVRPGQMLLVDPGAGYRALLRRSVTTRGYCLYLPGSPAMLPTEPPLIGRALIQSTAANPLGVLLMHQATKLHREGVEGVAPNMFMAEARTALNQTLAAATSQMARLDVKKLSTRREVMNRLEVARAYLHGHGDRAVPLAELASITGLSSFHLVRYFSAAFGVPPARYHRRLRLERAAELLLADMGTVSEIADGAGYGDLSAFTHAFTRQFGMSPSAWVRARGGG